MDAPLTLSETRTQLAFTLFSSGAALTGPHIEELLKDYETVVIDDMLFRLQKRADAKRAETEVKRLTNKETID